MAKVTPGDASPQPIRTIDEPTIKITHDNLDEALRVLRTVLDEEAQR